MLFFLQVFYLVLEKELEELQESLVSCLQLPLHPIDSLFLHSFPKQAKKKWLQGECNDYFLINSKGGNVAVVLSFM